MTEQQNQEPEVEEEYEHIVAKPGGKYPVRLLHLINGMLVMGFVLRALPDSLMVLRPYEVITHEQEDGTIPAYELEPYLDQLAEYDANTMLPVPFMTANIVGVVIPAKHLMQSYMTHIRLRENFEALDEYPIRQRHYPSANTKH